MIRLLLALVLAAATAHAAPPDLSTVGWDEKPGAAVPQDAAFTDQAGRRVALHDLLDGRPLVLQLGYYHCPVLCGSARNDARAALADSGLHAGPDYQMAFLAIDPAETPADAADAWSADQARHPVPGDAAALHYLTGHAAPVAAAIGARYRYEEALHQFIHPAGLVVLTPGGTVSSYLGGVGQSGAALREAVRLAGQGQAVRTPDPILLLCFHYDELTGRYSADVMTLMRLGAALTVGTVGALVLVLRRAERTRA